MSDRHAEGIEKAAAAFYNDPSGLTDWARMSEKDPALAEKYRAYISAAMTAYLDHAFPEVTSAPALWGLPDATILRDAEGVVWEVDSDEDAQWACVMGHEDGYPREDIALPARVIWWGLG